jgi:hypothetical protein
VIFINFSELTIKLLLIFLPGIIATIIVDNLTTHRNRDFKYFIINSYLLGMLTYLLLNLLISINNSIVIWNGFEPTLKMKFLGNLLNMSDQISIKEVFFATLLAILIGIIVSVCINYKIFHQIAIKLGITRKFGDADVWQYTFNSPDITWVIVRNIDTDIMYQGWVHAFSDTCDINELFLRQVTVYKNSTGIKLYEMDGIYIKQNKDVLVLEFPLIGNE